MNKYSTAAPAQRRPYGASQHPLESLQSLATRYRIIPKTVAKWRKRPGLLNARMGLEPTVLSAEPEGIAIAFRWYTLWALDDCLYTLPTMILHLSRSARHRGFLRHGISRLLLREDGQSWPPNPPARWRLPNCIHGPC